MMHRRKEKINDLLLWKGKITECLEMLRWTEAISSTNTAPASLSGPSHPLTDFLLWVFVCLCVFLPVEMNVCVTVDTHYNAYSYYTFFLFQST